MTGRQRGTVRRMLYAAAAIVAVAAVVVPVVAFAGAMSPDRGTRPMSADQLVERRTDFLDDLWERVSEEYPEAIRPDVTIMSTLEDGQRVPAVARCLRGNGVAVEVVDGGIRYASSSGTPLDLAVTFYACQAQFPTIAQVTAELTTDQRGALYDYYVETASPCLAVSGVQLTVAPSRREFVEDRSSTAWTPYRAIGAGDLSTRELVRLESRCPAVPPWLDFRT